MEGESARRWSSSFSMPMGPRRGRTLEPINYFNSLAPLFSRAAVGYPDGHYREKLAQLFLQQTPLQQLELRLGVLRVLA